MSDTYDGTAGGTRTTGERSALRRLLVDVLEAAISDEWVNPDGRCTSGETCPWCLAAVERLSTMLKLRKAIKAAQDDNEVLAAGVLAALRADEPDQPLPRGDRPAVARGPEAAHLKIIPSPRDGARSAS